MVSFPFSPLVSCGMAEKPKNHPVNKNGREQVGWRRKFYARFDVCERTEYKQDDDAVFFVLRRSRSTGNNDKTCCLAGGNAEAANDISRAETNTGNQ